MGRDIVVNKRGAFYTLERPRLKSNGFLDILIGI